MSNGSDRGSSLALPGLLVLALAVYGIYNVTAPLDVLRPSSQGVRPILLGGVEPIPARLWEDPFLAYQRAAARAGEDPLTIRVESRSPLPPNRVPGWRAHGRGLPAGPELEGDTLVLAVVAQSGSYADDAEDRKRARYAVLSALGDTGFSPVDGEHLGAFGVVSGPFFFDGVLGESPATQYVLPFERFEHNEDAGLPPEGAVAWDSVLVVWVPDGMLSDRPLEALHGTLEGIDDQLTGSSRRSYAILGPTTSSALAKAVGESGRCRYEDCPIRGAALISSWATISDPELDGTGIQEPLKVLKVRELAYGLRLFRQIETDETLIVPLVDELARRGILPGRDPIALVTEWNTNYGSAFHSALGRYVPKHLTRFVYMQGIDGRIPLPSGTLDDDAASTAEDQEDPLGRRQTDYLRRLVETMGGRNFRAIGIVGSDVYDKLLVLRALRPHFPHALFFTTDLDVRFLDEEERPWTRNLLVASHFGLDPNVEIKREGLRTVEGARDTQILPMRGSYQTGTFLACKRALTGFEVKDQPPSQDPREVQLYEISRTGAYDLDVSWTEDLTGWLLAALPVLLLLALFSACEISEARVSVKLGKTGHAIALLAFAGGTLGALWGLAREVGWSEVPQLIVIPLLIVAVVFRVWYSFRARIDTGSPGAEESGGIERTVPRLIAFACVVSLVFGAMLFVDSNVGSGEPLAVFQGVSVWPSIGIRVVVILASAWFLFLLDRRVESWNVAIEERFGLDLFEEDSRQRSRWLSELREFALHPLRFFLLFERHPEHDWVAGKRAELKAGWTWYRGQDERRLGRSIRAVVLFSGLLLAAYFLEESHNGLARGSVARFFNLLTWWLSMLGVSLLLFFVLDATQTCRKLILPLADPDRTILWPKRARKRMAFIPDRVGYRVAENDRSDDSYMDGLLDIRFVADLTAVLSSLVWYPFGLLALLILAQNSFFENWSWSASSITLFGVLAGLMLLAAARLRTASERLRRRSLDRLRQFQLHSMMEGGGKSDDLDELAFAIDEVRTMRKGAFLPFAQHPIVTAILLPFGGVGTIAIFEKLVS